jgi:hypothetical protein
VKRLLGWALVFLSLASGGQALADVPPDVHTAAEAAFREGTELFAQARYDEALARFEASERMEPGPGKRFNMAMSQARLHRPATAWVLFRDAAVEFEHEGAPDRAELARLRAAEIEPTLPRLRIRVAQRLPGLHVTRNGADVPADAWNADVPVDPGPSEVRAGAIGFVDWAGRVEVPERAFTVELVVPPLERLPAVAPPPPAEVPPAKSSGGMPRWVGWASVGVAVVAGGLGTYEGMTAGSRWDDAKPMCHGSGSATTCTSQGASLVRSANGYATVSTVAFAVAGVALAGGVAWWMLAPSTKGATVGVQARF